MFGVNASHDFGSLLNTTAGKAGSVHGRSTVIAL